MYYREIMKSLFCADVLSFRTNENNEVKQLKPFLNLKLIIKKTAKILKATDFLILLFSYYLKLSL